MKILSSRPKRKYKVTMNWQGEIHIVYRWATSIDNAMQLALISLANTLGMSKANRLANHFRDGADRIKVEEVKGSGKESIQEKSSTG